jgi:hypothetical protein
VRPNAWAATTHVWWARLVYCSQMQPCCSPPSPLPGVANKDADHAASHVGKAVGITTLLRGTGYHASRRRSYLPIELCAEHGLSQVRGVYMCDSAITWARCGLLDSQPHTSTLPPCLLRCIWRNQIKHTRIKLDDSWLWCAAYRRSCTGVWCLSR